MYLVEAADDICYEIMDIEDAHKLRILSFDETMQLLLGFFDNCQREKILKRIDEEGITDNNEKVVYLRACTIGKLENECARAFVEHESEILNGTLQGCLIDHITPSVRDAYRHCSELSVQRIYNSKPVLDVELSGYKIMETLMDALIEAAVSPEKFHSEQLRKRFSNQYDINSPDFETRVMAVIDFISGMTVGAYPANAKSCKSRLKVFALELPIIFRQRIGSHVDVFVGENGIINGTTDGKLNPQGNASRAQFACMIARFEQGID